MRQSNKWSNQLITGDKKKQIAQNHSANNQIPLKFNSFFARVSLLSNLLQSQLATPLLYPLNSRSLGGDGIRLSQMNNPKWDKATLTYGLAQVAPAISGLSRIATVLRAGHALRHFRGRSAKMVSQNRTRTIDSSSTNMFNNNSYPKQKLSRVIKAEIEGLHLSKPQIWRMRRPLYESETVHLGWRASGPPPFLKGSGPK